MAKIDVSREYADPEEGCFPDPILLDKYRITHSTSFRRLGYKTQVFVPFEADHFRTRLTHTIEVANIARILAERFSANADLAEAISLAHDLGHGPFGHSSETILNKLLADEGGFEHNRQSIRVVRYLEHPYPWFLGLNLTKATLDGLAMHSTPYDTAQMETKTSLLEAEIANFADRFAYNISDLEDAFGAGFADHNELIEIELYRHIWEELPRTIKELPIYKIRRVICNNMQKKLIDALKLKKGRIELDSSIHRQLKEFEQFMLEKVYLHPALRKTADVVHSIIEKLFMYFERNPQSLPNRYQARIETDKIRTVICDYITGMTDRFCIKTYINIFGEDDLVKSIETINLII